MLQWVAVGCSWLQGDCNQNRQVSFNLICYKILCFLDRFYVGEVSIKHSKTAQTVASGFNKKVQETSQAAGFPGARQYGCCCRKRRLSTDNADAKQPSSGDVGMT